MIPEAKARVLPLPVALPPIISSPAKTSGIVFFCISVGLSKPSPSSIFSNWSLRPSSLNFSILLIIQFYLINFSRSIFLESQPFME